MLLDRPRQEIAVQRLAEDVLGPVDVAVACVPAGTTDIAAGVFLAVVANRTCLRAVGFVHLLDVDAFCFCFVDQIDHRLAETPVGQLLRHFFAFLPFDVAFDAFHIANVDRRNLLCGTPIHEVFGCLMQGILQLAGALGADEIFGLLVFLPLTRTFFALRLQLLQFGQLLVAQLVDAAHLASAN